MSEYATHVVVEPGAPRQKTRYLQNVAIAFSRPIPIGEAFNRLIEVHFDLAMQSGIAYRTYESNAGRLVLSSSLDVPHVRRKAQRILGGEVEVVWDTILGTMYSLAESNQEGY